MSAAWKFEESEFGPRMVMMGEWSSGALNAAKSAKVRALSLNYAKGWAGHDYGFLERLPELECLDITDWNAKDISAVNGLSHLRYLSVETSCKSEIDFERLPDLRKCAIEWRTKARSVFQHTGIEDLFINKYPGKDFSAFEKMNLKSLALPSTRIESFLSVDSLKNLEFLGVYIARNLSSLDGIQHLGRLTHLEVNDCVRISDVSPLRDLVRLEELHLCANKSIQSIKPLSGLSALKVFLFYESTNVLDGDLSVLKALPNLHRVAFMERRHYSHKMSDFE